MDDAQNTVLRLMKTQVDPGPFGSIREFGLQIVVSGKALLTSATSAQRAKLARWAAPLAGVVPGAIDTSSATAHSITLVWFASVGAPKMAARGAARFAARGCPQPPVNKQGSQVEAMLKPLGLKVVAFKLLDPTGGCCLPVWVVGREPGALGLEGVAFRPLDPTGGCCLPL